MSQHFHFVINYHISHIKYKIIIFKNDYDFNITAGN